MDQNRWFKLSLAEQLANIGSEVRRVNTWKTKNEPDNMHQAADRALELMDLTLSDLRWQNRLKELTRLREIFCDYFMNQNNYILSGTQLNDYFLPFAILSRKYK